MYRNFFAEELGQMPLKGYTSLTLRKDAVERFRQVYAKNKEKYLKSGITGTSSFLMHLLNEEEKKNGKEGGELK
jgi:hypothetical protein